MRAAQRFSVPLPALIAALLVCMLGACSQTAGGAAQAGFPGAEPPPQPTRIEADNEHHVIRFVVDGEIEALLDKEGFRVRHDLDYSGLMTDRANQDFEDRVLKQQGSDGDGRQ